MSVDVESRFQRSGLGVPLALRADTARVAHALACHFDSCGVFLVSGGRSGCILQDIPGLPYARNMEVRHDLRRTAGRCARSQGEENRVRRKTLVPLKASE